MEPKKDTKKVAKENSYYYWWDDKNKTPGLKGPNPNAQKKISMAEAQKVGLNGSKSNKKASDWNNMGTWEEKNYKVEEFEEFVHDRTGRLTRDPIELEIQFCSILWVEREYFGGVCEE